MPLTSRSLLRYALVVAIASPPVLAASCARQAQVESGFDDGGGPGPANTGGPDATLIGTSTPTTGDGGGFMVNTADGGTGKCTVAHQCNDFPTTPIMDTAGATPLPANAQALFSMPATSTSAAAPCLVEPADGALFPKNWLRLRILWVPATKQQNLFEVRVHSDGELNDLVAYTTNQFYTIDKALWQTISTGTLNAAQQLIEGNLVGQTLTVSVRGVSTAGGMASAAGTAKMTLAPAIADGALVYWTTASFDNSQTNTTLAGFTVGDEGTTTALQANQVVQPVRATPLDGGNLTGNFQQVFCIGCHTATPDGNYVAFTAQWPWPSTLASIQATSQGAVPPWLAKGAVQNLSPNYGGNVSTVSFNPPAVNQIMLGVGTFGPSHYTTGDRIYIATLGSSWNSFSLSDVGVASGVTSQLAWFNLEWDSPASAAGGLVDGGLPAATPCTPAATYPGIMGAVQPCIPPVTPNAGWGVITRTGDTKGAGAPSWSHNVDGATDVIAYVSTNVGVKDGRMDCSGPATANCTADVYTVPYNSNGPGLGGAGGAATPLPGAADPKFNEYYPAWSPDDQFIAFNRVPTGTRMYDTPAAEVWVVPYNRGKGGTAVPVTSNFPPPACANPYPMGAQNTWPKWAPNPLATLPDGGTAPAPQVDANGNTYYWLTFSSIRSPTAGINPADAGSTSAGKPKQQLYVVGVVVDAQGNITSYAPIYLWNQNFQVNNLIPAWGEFKIPPGVTPPPVMMAQ